MDPFDISKLAANDATEWKRLNDYVAQIAVDFARSNQLSLEDAQDIAQNALCYLFRRIQAKRLAFLAPGLIHITVENYGLSHLRSLLAIRRDVRKTVSLEAMVEESGGAYDPPAPDPNFPVNAEDEKQVACRALATLGEPCRSQLQDYFFEALTYEELAKKYDCTVGAMRVKIFRCLKNLKQTLEKLKCR